ncbi:MAG TPA: pyridoxal-dependent decarboxylase [Polyangiales bacterium]
MKRWSWAPQDNGISPLFQSAVDDLLARFFSRDPQRYPFLGDPMLRELLAFRTEHPGPGPRVDAYPQGAALLHELTSSHAFPQRSSDPGSGSLQLSRFAAALSKSWETPAAVENVAGVSSDPAILGCLLGTIANANLVHRDYSEMADDLEASMVRKLALLAGYDPSRATGIFTSGGTLCNLYGYLLGIRKSLPEAKHHGMGYTHDYRIINSLGGHYTHITNLSLLGVNIREKVIRIRIGDANAIDLADLEHQLEACFRLKCAVPSIMLTMGTTDTFGVDRVKPVFEIRNRLCERYEIRTPPHIHVDAAVGWAMLFFKDYDFDRNPLDINPTTLAGLRWNTERFRELRYADSFSVDFHKWGFVPYTSSVVMIKERDDLRFMEADPENFTYFEDESQGHTHLQSTIECSRSAIGLFGAHAALEQMGIEGFQIAMAHGLQNANYFRQRLAALPHVHVVARENQGPSVGFRIYDPARVSDAEQEFALEHAFTPEPEALERARRNDWFHRELFLRRGKVGLSTNWVKSVTHTAYDDRGRFRALPGEKAVFMNMRTTRAAIDGFVEHLMG